MQSSNLYVGNLSYSVTGEDLRELFSRFGEVREAKVIGDRGFGFVEMGTKEEAAKAIEELNETDYEGRTLKVSEARPRQEKRDRGGYQKSGYKRY
ncbi:MAG: RNA-binding protein [Candidatus Zixiibacteriota bacterium]|nr:MAG: RNA-binding protein [candidate division Zixibacteria bacterium]